MDDSRRELRKQPRADTDDIATAVRALAPAVLDGAPAFIGICDRDFTPIFLNSAGRAMVRFPERKSVSSVAINEFFAADQRALITRIGLPTIAREGQWEQDVSFRDWSDPKHQLGVHYFAFGIYDHRKEFLAGVTITREIVTRQKAVGAVRENHAMVNELLGMLPLGIGVFDGSGRLMHSNGSWRRHGLTSLPARSAGRRARWTPTREVSDNSPRDAGTRALAGEPVAPRDWPMVEDGQHPKIFRVSAWPLAAIGKAENGAAVIVEDVDELQRTKASLEYSEARLHLAAEVSGLGTFSFDPVLALFTWDERHCRLWGILRNEPGDWQTFENGIHPEDAGRVRAAIGSCFSAGKARHLSVRYRVVGRDDGRVRRVSTHLSSIFDGGHLRALIGASVEAAPDERTIDTRS